MINTPVGTGARTDGYEIRTAAVARGIPCITTMTGGMAAARAICRRQARGEPEVLSLQEIHAHAQSSSAVTVSRVLAPFGRRARPSPRASSTAPTSCCAARTRTARARRPASSTC